MLIHVFLVACFDSLVYNHYFISYLFHYFYSIMVDKSDKEDRFRCEIDFSEIEASNYNPLAWLIRPCEWYQQEYRDCICK